MEQKTKILAIDDNGDNLATLVAVLKDLLPDAAVVTTQYGPQGIELARQEQPDIILLDVVMPEMDGYEVCRILKRNDDTKHIPVVFLTALKTTRETRIAAIDAGAEGFLSKPLDEAELLVQIRAMRNIKALHDLQEKERIRLAEEKDRLSELVSIRTRELTKELNSHYETANKLLAANKQLQESQNATLNLLEDLKSEVEARKLSEEVLRRSEEQLKMAQRVANVGSWVWHIAEDRLEWSDQMYAIFDMDAETFTGSLALVLEHAIHPDDLPKVLSVNQSVVEKGKPYPIEYRILREDGSTRIVWAEAGELELDGHGRPLRLSGIVQDITQSKLAEEALREREERWRTIIKTSPDGIAIAMLDGEIEEVSDKAVTMFGYEHVTEVLGSNIITFVHESQHSAVMSSIELMLAGDYSGQSEFRVRRKDGSLFWAEINSEFLRDHDGVPVRIIFVLRDITLRKDAEQAILESRERFDLAMQATQDGLYDWRLLCNDIYFSPAWKSMLGYADDELPNEFHIWEELIHPDDVRNCWTMLDQVLKRQRDRFEMEFRMKHKDGHWVDIISRANAIFDDNAVPVRVVGTHVDISDRKKVEEELRRSYELLNNLAAQVPGVVYQYVLHPDGSSAFPYSSPGIYDIYEVRPEDVREDASPVFEHLHPDDREWLTEAILHSAKTLELFHFEFRVNLPKQGIRWRLCDAKPERLENGGTLWHGIITDITDRKHSEQMLRESEERLRAITESAQDAIVMMDAGARITYWNPAATEIFGYSAKEVIGQNPHLFLAAAAHTDDAVQAFTTFISTGNSSIIGSTVEMTGRRKDGIEISISLSLSVASIRGEAHSVAIIRDITDWKLAEITLKESESRFRSMIEHSPIAYQSLDGSGCFIDVNQEVCTLLGRTRDDLLDTSFGDLWSPESREHFSASFEAFLRAGSAQSEITLMGTNGDRIVVELEGRVQRDAQGRFIRTHCVLFDVTERKRIELALRESDEFTNAILDSVEAHIAVLDAEGTIVAVNEPWRHFSLENSSVPGMTAPRTGVGVNYFEICAKATGLDKVDADKVMLGIRALLDGQKDAFSYEYPCHSELEQRWFLLSATRLGDHGKGIVLAHTNITQRKIAEQSLRESESLYRSLFDEHSATKLLIDPATGAIVDANNAAAAFYGWDRDTLKTMRMQQINMLPAAALKSEMAEAVKNRGGHYEFQHRLADASIRDVEVFSGAIRIRGKDFLHSVIHDVTGKKEAERRLKLLGRSVEQSPVGIIITNPDGDIEYVNPEYCIITGFDEDEIIGRNSRFLKSGQHSPDFYRDLWESILSGKDWFGELCNKRKDGELYWERAVISPVLNDGGTITHFVAIKQDMTKERQMMSDLVIAKERAEESDRLKSTFLANMSHEVRTPMNAIIGFSDLINDPSLSAMEREQYGEIIKQRSYDLLAIIDDILDISLIQAGEMKIHEEECSIDELLHDLKVTFHHIYIVDSGHKAALNCINELPGDENYVVLDTRRVRQVLSNLLSNAFKFTAEGSISFGCRAYNENELHFFVSDTGIGIPAPALDFIFNRFRQVDESSTRPYGGTGLGLSISQGFVELMGGKIWVDSEEGRGSNFQFTLPWIRARH